MKRNRVVYAESDEAREATVHAFIRSLQLSVPLHTLHAAASSRQRRACPSCHKHRLYYCYDCLTVVHPETHPPPLRLPLSVYVLLHPGELRSKSTSLAAATISPDVHIVPYPDVPAHLDPTRTLVLYPSPQAVELGDVADLARYDSVVFVESTWQQSKSVARDARVRRFTHVRLRSYTSLFWRFQNNDTSHLATVEAIYYFLREYVTQRNKSKAATATATASDDDSKPHPTTAPQPGTNDNKVKRDDDKDADCYYHGEVDDLLLYYIYQYISIQRRYSRDTTAHFTDRHFAGYVLRHAAWDSLLAPPQRAAQCADGGDDSSNGNNGGEDDDDARRGTKE